MHSVYKKQGHKNSAHFFDENIQNHDNRITQRNQAFNWCMILSQQQNLIFEGAVVIWQQVITESTSTDGEGQTVVT